jgi:hypothetical protein
MKRKIPGLSSALSFSLAMASWSLLGAMLILDRTAGTVSGSSERRKRVEKRAH